jgi:hypothetical protein
MKTPGINGTLKIRRLRSLLMMKLIARLWYTDHSGMEKEDNININAIRRASI